MLKPVLLALPALWLGFASSSVLAQQAGRIDLLDGEVRITDTKAKARTPKLGETVSQGETVTTGKNGELHLKMDDGGVIALRPEAQLTIVRFQNKGRDSDVSLVSLVSGAMRAITGFIGRRMPERVNVQTPTATIGIRGTDHEVAVTPTGTFNKVNSGGTRVKNERGEVDVSPGQAALASPNAAPAVLPSVPDVFQPRASDSRLEGLNDRLQRSPDTRAPVAPPAPPQASGQPAGGERAAAGQGTGKGGTRIQGNTTINAVGKDTNAVAVGQGNEASNQIGTIGK